MSIVTTGNLSEEITAMRIKAKKRSQNTCTLIVNSMNKKKPSIQEPNNTFNVTYYSL